MAEDGQADLPFRAEYAKSNRSSCKGCKMKIDKAELRLAIMVQSPMFDGKVPHWYHLKCFFGRARPKAVGDIGHFDQLRWEDQEKITKMLASSTGGGEIGGGKKSKKGSSAVSMERSKHGTLLKDFRVEYSKSGGAMCKVCEVKISKGIVRIAKKEYDSERARAYGPYDRWNHVDCFVKIREELEYFDDAEVLAGFKTLSADDQAMLRGKVKKMKRKTPTDDNEGPDAKKAKTGNGGGAKQNPKELEALKKQNKKLFYYRDMLQRHVSKKELEELLENNDQEVPTGEERILDRLADCMMFGALEPCKECISGQLVYRSGVGYGCTGNISEWTKCQFKTAKPVRREFRVPKAFKESYDFFKLYKSKVTERVIPNLVSTVKPANDGNSTSENGTASSVKAKPLANLTFILDEHLKEKSKIESKIESLGGKVGQKVSSKIAALIANEDALKNKSKAIKSAESRQIQVVSIDVLEKLETKGIIQRIKDCNLCEWGADPKERIGDLVTKAEEKVKAKSGSGGGSTMFTKDLPKSMKLKLKGGAFVDPESGLDHKAHVLKVKDCLYSAVLGAVNIQEGRNSYYKLQLLQHDKKPKWYVFRSWGRVGTTIGGTKLEDFHERESAVEVFKTLYVEKTGNRWSKRNEFQKVAGKFFPLEMDFGQESADVAKLDLKLSKSKLDKPIQELITLIFDVDSMKKALVEFEIDLTKMPLGKISKRQIMDGYKILTEVMAMVNEGTGTETLYLDASNRFFTLIPHDFGMKSPPILRDPDYVKSKISMLDSLLEIEVAFNLLKSEEKENSKEKDPIDAHYEKLKTKIQVLDRKTDEFKILEKYVKNTHASTHGNYTLEIEQIFKVARNGEREKYEKKKYDQMDNKMLLWHGSRTTNYAGILSQGLRIAPPEAPVTGYMFGKGVYFADMVSKSANYCCTNRTNNTGLLLLCEVALGDMYERKAADYIEKLPAGKNSCKGLGKTHPDPTAMETLDGIKVPVGKGTAAPGTADSSLLYNEYIVYDEKQCNMKYLFRMKFNYKY